MNEEEIVRTLINKLNHDELTWLLNSENLLTEDFIDKIVSEWLELGDCDVNTKPLLFDDGTMIYTVKRLHYEFIIELKFVCDKTYEISWDYSLNVEKGRKNIYSWSRVTATIINLITEKIKTGDIKSIIFSNEHKIYTTPIFQERLKSEINITELNVIDNKTVIIF